MSDTLIVVDDDSRIVVTNPNMKMIWIDNSFIITYSGKMPNFIRRFFYRVLLDITFKRIEQDDR